MNCLKERSIGLCILFSIITCGIYGLYWIYKITEEVNELTDNTNDTSPGLVLLLCIVTCGIYNIYWAYRIGTKIKEFYEGKSISSNSDLPVLYLILYICNYVVVGITSLVCMCLMQDEINKMIRNNKISQDTSSCFE